MNTLKIPTATCEISLIVPITCFLSNACGIIRQVDYVELFGILDKVEYNTLTWIGAKSSRAFLLLYKGSCKIIKYLQIFIEYFIRNSHMNTCEVHAHICMIPKWPWHW